MRSKLELSWGLTAVVFLIAIFLTFNGCGEDKTTDSNNPGGNIITPEGGTVTDPGGASVTVPPGAVDENVTISITTYHSGSALPISAPPFLEFLGGADFAPTARSFWCR